MKKDYTASFNGKEFKMTDIKLTVDMPEILKMPEKIEFEVFAEHMHKKIMDTFLLPLSMTSQVAAESTITAEKLITAMEFLMGIKKPNPINGIEMKPVTRYKSWPYPAD